jgi:hypothetical protein
MSQQTLDKRNRATKDGRRSGNGAQPTSDARKGHADIPGLLAQMTPKERIRAYRTGSISRRELTIAAARESDRMPICNGEFEWIALSLPDLD